MKTFSKFPVHLEGEGPSCGLVLSGTTLYGTTVSGSSFGHGTIYKFNTDGGGFAVLKHFSGGWDHPVGVYYDGTRHQWAIFNEDGVSMIVGPAFNVLVINP